MASNLPPGVTDAMIDAQCARDLRCENCPHPDADPHSMDQDVCPGGFDFDSYACEEDARAEDADRRQDR